VTARFHAVQSRAEFLEVLRSIADDARLHSHWPILHIEVHGDFTGIVVASGEYLPWREFEDELIAINESSRLNLLVMIAACKGASLFKIMLSQLGRRGRAPMRSLIGPKRNVTASEIEHACPAFYRVLFDTGDGRAAWRAMNDAVAPGSLTFDVFTAEHTFHTIMYMATSQPTVRKMCSPGVNTRPLPSLSGRADQERTLKTGDNSSATTFVIIDITLRASRNVSSSAICIQKTLPSSM
jgi:hypothetical protein